MTRLRRRPSFAARLVAGLCAALVLLLAVLAACPAAHEWIHGHEGHATHSPDGGGTHSQNAADPDDDGCVVTLFAHGVVSAAIFTTLAVAFFLLISPVAQPREALCLPAPRYRLPPLCGPPQS
ncbi:MAG TPA: hypothetical protein VK717_13650 [Opitutaceae bacterium]|nr:hypothetical protein [Opitutaceae bacterium]